MAGSVFIRHPRYAIVLAFLLASSLYLILPLSGPPGGFTPLRFANNDFTDLSYRMAQAEVIYERTIQERAGLIERYGPKASEIDM